MELHTLVQSVLGGLGHGQITAAEHIVEGNRRRLSSEHGNTVAFLGHILVIALLGDGIGAGHQIVDVNFTVSVGGNALIDALAGDGEGNAVHLAVLADLDDFGTAVRNFQTDISLDRVINLLTESDSVLISAARLICTVRPNNKPTAL